MAEERSLVWKCGCGKTKLKITGEPFLAVNCCCHSCVAVGRFIDEKHATDQKHTSGLIDDRAAYAFYKPSQVKEDTELSPELFGCVKVGPKGKPQRQYVKCCGTQFGSAMPACWGLNRNAVYESDGTTKYAPVETPTNIMKKYAFDPEKVPEPSANMMSCGDMMKMMGTMMNPFGPSVDKATLKKLKSDPATAEEVPITWE